MLHDLVDVGREVLALVSDLLASRVKVRVRVRVKVRVRVIGLGSGSG